MTIKDSNTQKEESSRQWAVGGWQRFAPDIKSVYQFDVRAIMIQLPRNATDEQILNEIRTWIELLAQKKYHQAFDMLRNLPSGEWSPELIKTVITNYGFIEPREDGATFKVTSLKDVPEGQAFQGVQWYGDDPNRPAEYLGLAAHTLPLNGSWSDVTAMFHIVEENGELVLELEDIHVL